MAQIRSKMVKSGEIISRGEGYGGWTKTTDQEQQQLQQNIHPGLDDQPLDNGLQDLHMEMGMHAGAVGDIHGQVDVAHCGNMLGSATYPHAQARDDSQIDPNIQSLQELQDHEGLTAAQAQALMAHQTDDFRQQHHHDNLQQKQRQHDLRHDEFSGARHQHELLAQHSMAAQQAAQEQMANRQIEQVMGRDIAGQQDGMSM
jgi:hypothetical protein